MRDLNSCIFIGRLTRDAELKATQGGAAIVSFALAVNGSEKQGEKWEDRASFFDFAYFGKAAEAVHPYLKKGQQVAVTALAIQDRWEKDGEKHQRVKFIVQSLNLLGGKRQGEGPLAEPVTREAAHDGGFADDISF